MSMRQSHTAVIERNAEWEGAICTEPYEASWASEAIFFVRLLEAEGVLPVELRVQISPDGMCWCDEGTCLELDLRRELSFARLRHFGGWLRLRGQMRPGQRARAIVYLQLKE